MRAAILIYISFAIFAFIYPQSSKKKTDKKSNQKIQKLDKKEKTIQYKDCEPIANQIFTNFLKEAMPDHKKEFLEMEDTFKQMIMADCRSGKYKLDCLKSVTNSADLQSCKK